MGKEPSEIDFMESDTGLTGEIDGALPDLPLENPSAEGSEEPVSPSGPDADESEAQDALSPSDPGEKESETLDLIVEQDEEDPVIAGVYQAIAKLEVVQHQLRHFHQDFDIKLREDAHKEKIIDNLHEELQEYKNNIFSVQRQSMTMDLIRIIDDIRKFSNHYRSIDPSERDLDKLLDYLEQLPSDIEDLFLLRGITPFEETSSAIDPTRQRIVKKIVTDNQFQDRVIAARLRPGYECEGRVVRPEMIAVYVYEPQEDETKSGMRDSNG